MEPAAVPRRPPLGVPRGIAEPARAARDVRHTDAAYELARKPGVKTAWGTDIPFSPEAALEQSAQLSKMVRWYKPAEVLRMATSDDAGLLALSGLRSLDRGRLGVVQEGALADLLLVDGDPLENLALIADPEKNFLLIVKDGRIYKQRVS